MWAILASKIIRYRIAIMVAMAAVTAFMLLNAGGLQIYYGLPRMLPDDDPTLRVFDEFQLRFQEKSTVFAIGIEENLFDNVEVFNAWYELGRTVSNVEGVDTVLSIGSAFNIVKDTVDRKFGITPIVRRKVKSQAELDSLRLVFESLPFYRNLIYNDKNNYSLMAISMSNELFNSTRRSELLEKVITPIHRFEENQGVKIHYSGMPFIRETLSALVKSELRLFIGMTLFVTILILFIFFRSFRTLMIAMLVVGLGVIWSLGIIKILGYDISILTSLIPSLIIVIGIPNCVYLINEFHREIKDHGNRTKAIIRVVVKIGKATFMTNATTAAGFLTFIFTDSIILVEFGIVAFLSIMSLFTISVFTITIAYSYMAPPRESVTDHLGDNWATRFVTWVIEVVTYHRRWVYSITIVLVCAAAYGLTLIEVTGNIVDDLPDDHPIVDDLRWFEGNFGGVVPFEIEINAGKPKQILRPNVLEAIDSTSAYFSRDPLFSRSISIADALKFVRQAFYNGNPERYALIPNSERAFFKPYIDNAGSSTGPLYTYLDSTQQYARISLKVADIGTPEMDSLLAVVKPSVDGIFNPKRAKQDSLFMEMESTKNAALRDSIALAILERNGSARRSLERELAGEDSTLVIDTDSLDYAGNETLRKQLKAAVDKEYIGINFTGPSVVFLAGTNYLVNNLFTSLGFAILMIAFLMALVFNSFRMIVVSVVTNLIPLLFTGAVMGYFGVAIKPSTLLVFSIAFGISVDDTIHYLTKYRIELRHFNNDIGKSVRAALKGTGVSMIFTSVILFFGFSVFDLSEFGGTQALGILVSLTLLVAMLCNVILLPSFLMSFERRMLTKSFQEPLLTILDEDEDIEFGSDEPLVKSPLNP